MKNISQDILEAIFKKFQNRITSNKSFQPGQIVLNHYGIVVTRTAQASDSPRLFEIRINGLILTDVDIPQTIPNTISKITYKSCQLSLMHSIEGIKGPDLRIIFENCIYQEYCQIVLNDCSLSKFVFFTSKNPQQNNIHSNLSLHIINSSIDHIIINSRPFMNENLDFLSLVNIYNVQIARSISFYNINDTTTVNLNKIKAKSKNSSISFSQCNLDKFVFTGIDISINFRDCKFLDVLIVSPTTFLNNTHINQSSIIELQLIEHHTSSKLKISDTHIHTIFIRDFECDHKCKLIDVSPDSSNHKKPKLFIAADSDLSNLWLHNLNLNDYDQITIKNTNFQGASLNKFNLPSPNEFKAKTVRNTPNRPVTWGKSQWSHIREVYRQIKLNYKSQEDKVLYLKYKGFELEALEQELNSKESPKNKSNILDKWILKISKTTSNHGQNVIKALAWTIFASLFFTLLINFTLRKPLPFPCIGDIYWDLLNPAHTLSKIEAIKTNITASTKALSFFYRIVLGYLYYQILISLRKYTKQ